MKTPTWATAIGIIMIVLGGCSVLNDIQAIGLPDKIEKDRVEVKKKMEEARAHARDSVSLQSADSVTRAKAEADEKRFKKQEKEVEASLKIPEFSKIWIVRFGYIGLAVTLLYITAGIFLLVKRSFSIKLVYAALVISMLTSGTQAAFLTSSASSGVIALTTAIGQVVGIVVDVILIAVIFSSDKEAYTVGTTPRSNS